MLAVAMLAGHDVGAAQPLARVSLDAKDAPVVDVVRVLAEAGGFQVVHDPDVRCRLTLKIHQATWRAVLDSALAACGLGFEEEADVLRVAPLIRLREEAEARRKLDAERTAKPQGRLALFRLSYARAQHVAPLLDRMLAPAGRVSYDARTNTLLVAY
jgi:type II secretory pathway component HofQ